MSAWTQEDKCHQMLQEERHLLSKQVGLKSN